MILAILILLAIDIAIMAVLAVVALRHGKHPQPVDQPQPFAFSKNPHCVKCGKYVDENPLEAHVNANLIGGKTIPVTMKICQECVALA